MMVVVVVVVMMKMMMMVTTDECTAYGGMRIGRRNRGKVIPVTGRGGP
jgi:hypothetical protein